jgi:phenylacetic acid degradation operon negative regulatory protein
MTVGPAASFYTPEELRRAFSAFPSGVTGIAAIVDGEPRGLAASSFTSVSLDPPLVSVCIASTSSTWPLLRSASRLGVSILAEDQADVARHLASKSPDRFDRVDWANADAGAVLIEGATLWLECSLYDELRAGDHDIALLKVERLHFQELVSPLVFHGSSFRRLAVPWPRPQSLVLDLFGEYLRYAGAEVSSTHLTRLLSDFEVMPPTVRLTMAGLVSDGWFTARESGDETYYKLSPEMLELLEEGRSRIFADPAGEWGREWTMVTYQSSTDDQSDRGQLRKGLAWHGFGQMTESTWIAPGDRREEVAALVSDSSGHEIDVLVRPSLGLEHDRSLTEKCWDLATLARDYETFNTEHRELLARTSKMRGSEALRTRTMLISHFRHFPFRDPRLPAVLLPKGWPGVEAYEVFRQAHAALGPAARAHVGQILGREMADPGTAAHVPTA